MQTSSDGRALSDRVCILALRKQAQQVQAIYVRVGGMCGAYYMRLVGITGCGSACMSWSTGWLFYCTCCPLRSVVVHAHSMGLGSANLCGRAPGTSVHGCGVQNKVAVYFPTQQIAWLSI